MICIKKLDFLTCSGLLVGLPILAAGVGAYSGVGVISVVDVVLVLIGSIASKAGSTATFVIDFALVSLVLINFVFSVGAGIIGIGIGVVIVEGVFAGLSLFSLLKTIAAGTQLEPD